MLSGSIREVGIYRTLLMVAYASGVSIEMGANQILRGQIDGFCGGDVEDRES